MWEIDYIYDRVCWELDEQRKRRSDIKNSANAANQSTKISLVKSYIEGLEEIKFKINRGCFNDIREILERLNGLYNSYRTELVEIEHQLRIDAAMNRYWDHRLQEIR